MTPNARPAKRTRLRKLELTPTKRARRYVARRLREFVRRRAATRDPAQAVSKRAPKKKKTYDSDEESDNYDDDSEVRPRVLSRSSENGARRSPTQDDWGAKQKKKAPAPKKAVRPARNSLFYHRVDSPVHPCAGPEAEASREAAAGAQSSAEGQSGP